MSTKRKSNPTLKQVARASALRLLAAGALKRRWSAFDRKQWTLAFNALQRLAGKKLVVRGHKLVSECAVVARKARAHA